ncbi:MAG: TetR/AcrR family transcriptional regulator [Zavarzinella sp.]|nr:TetR/AcrR family transcriptional regulator [Zavarzinella sp.]
MPRTKSRPKSVSDSGVARSRRDQIIEAAVGIITSHGLHKLSLSKIETRAGMKRGQLTYYFPTKEEILLAVFDRLLVLLCGQLAHKANPADPRNLPTVWDCVEKMLEAVLRPGPEFGREFLALQYTFLAQIAHREDFRHKLASVFAQWRDGIAAHWSDSGKPGPRRAKNVSGRTVSAFVQALVHGLTVQLAADAEAFDRAEMLKLCVGVLAPLFQTPSRSRGKEKQA